MKLVVIYDVPDEYDMYEEDNMLCEGVIPQDVVDKLHDISDDVVLDEYFTTSDVDWIGID